MSRNQRRLDSPLLDSDRESRTVPEKSDSPANSSVGGSPGERSTAEAGSTAEESGSSSRDERSESRDVADDEREDQDYGGWSRQQKRTFHRVHTLLSYWQQNGYVMRWITLTSSAESDGADRLAYNHRRLRQTLERASLAYDADGDAHRVSHINEIESLVIRTSEGPDGKGVLHLFWAWKPPEGNHSLDFFVPHKWLSEQWGRIHGPVSEHDDGDVQPLHVWIEPVGEADYHSLENLAGYCVSQYLGEHGEALENVSWSWERSLGGSVVDAWETVKSLVSSAEKAVELWHKVLGGEGITLSSSSDTVHFRKQVNPPPNLSVEVLEEVSVTPPDDWSPKGPHATHIKRESRNLEEVDIGKTRTCPDCGSARGLHALPEGHAERENEYHAERADVKCAACKSVFAAPGNGSRTVTDSTVASRWTWKQTRLKEFAIGRY